VNLRNACGTSNRRLAPSGLAGPTGNGEGGAARGGRLGGWQSHHPEALMLHPEKAPTGSGD
jgi:hypothetical protein